MAVDVIFNNFCKAIADSTVESLIDTCVAPDPAEDGSKRVFLYMEGSKTPVIVRVSAGGDYCVHDTWSGFTLLHAKYNEDYNSWRVIDNALPEIRLSQKVKCLSKLHRVVGGIFC